ncbi:MAG: phage major tail tube protein [Caulobacteraceae bacterium]|nr:MAG: phage major tail tube protein [Caulobacteraceae bacterium]
MRLPDQLKDLNVFGGNASFLGEVTTFTRPPMAITTEAHKGGGMLGEVQLQLGLEAMEAEVKFGGDQTALNAEFGHPRIDGSMLRFVGAYQRDDTGVVTTVEITTRGRYTEIDRGDDEKGGKTEASYKLALVYYKEVVNGRVAFEIDFLKGIWIVNGVDRWKEIREAIQ